MECDVCIIGGGLAGLFAGIRCAKQNKKTILLTKGLCTLNFASGALDVLSHANRKVVDDPFSVWDGFEADHPYSKISKSNMEKALEEYEGLFPATRFHLKKQSANVDFIAQIGNKKRSYLVPSSFFTFDPHRMQNIQSIGILQPIRFMDFYGHFIAKNLQKQFPQWKVSVIPFDPGIEEKVPPTRSAEFAHYFEQITSDQMLEALPQSISSYDITLIPAVLGFERHAELYAVLDRIYNTTIHEVMTMPPSIPGLRLEKMLIRKFQELGGRYVLGKRVLESQVSNGRVEYIKTDSRVEEKFFAKHYVLCTGKFLSEGLNSKKPYIKEPIFNLPIHIPTIKKADGREAIFDQSFFTQKGHPFIRAGVRTDNYYRPLDNNKELVADNLYTAGSILGFYDGVLEGCGGGVALASAYQCSQAILGATI